MSDAVDNAEVMLSCISLAYKESASKLLCSVTTVLSEWTHPAVPGSDVSKQRTYR